MSLEPKHIIKYLDKSTIEKNRSEILNLVIERIDQLCFGTCQLDRVVCTLTPMCNRRYLLNLRLMNGVDKIPEFCYGIQKNTVLRDFRNKTVIYKPNDAYLFMDDFFDIFFHGDYRKLSRFIAKGIWEKVYKIFDDRILYQNEDFEYIHHENYLIIKYYEKLHVLNINDQLTLCNAHRESIQSMSLLKGLCELYAKIYFPDVKIGLKKNKYVLIETKIPKDVLAKISNEFSLEQEPSKIDGYFWNAFEEDIKSLSLFCPKIRLYFDLYDNLNLKLYLNLKTNQISSDGKQLPLRFRDLKWILNFIYRLYTDFYILWL
ncbi:MAG: hypothetical protein ACFFBP_08610 [Promethearchaeota archaeon]